MYAICNSDPMFAILLDYKFLFTWHFTAVDYALPERKKMIPQAKELVKFITFVENMQIMKKNRTYLRTITSTNPSVMS